MLNLSVTFDFDRTLELIFVTLSLKVKVLDFRKEGKFKEEEDDRVNKVVLVIAVEHNTLKKTKKFVYLNLKKMKKVREEEG